MSAVCLYHYCCHSIIIVIKVRACVRACVCVCSWTIGISCMYTFNQLRIDLACVSVAGQVPGQRERERERERERLTERQRERERESERYNEWETEREEEAERAKDRERERERESGRHKEQETEKSEGEKDRANETMKCIERRLDAGLSGRSAWSIGTTWSKAGRFLESWAQHVIMRSRLRSGRLSEPYVSLKRGLYRTISKGYKKLYRAL